VSLERILIIAILVVILIVVIGLLA